MQKLHEFQEKVEQKVTFKIRFKLIPSTHVDMLNARNVDKGKKQGRKVDYFVNPKPKVEKSSSLSLPSLF